MSEFIRAFSDDDLDDDVVNADELKRAYDRIQKLEALKQKADGIFTTIVDVVGDSNTKLMDIKGLWYFRLKEYLEAAKEL